MNSPTPATRDNADLIEAMHQLWLENPEGVDPTWRAFFQGFALGSTGSPITGAADPQAGGAPLIDSLKQSHVHYLVGAYRAIGHLQAHLDPLSPPPPPTPKLKLSQFQLDESDLDTVFDVGTYLGGGQMKLSDIVASLQRTYCRHVGVEYAHIQDQECRLWLQERIESTRLQPSFTRPQKVRMLRQVHKEVPPYQIYRSETVLARGRRDHHCGARRRDRPLPRGGGRGDRHGDGPPGPPERAVQRHAKVL